ncbi:MAG: hypothetical protein HC767_07780 [Akkermansiaceae bacterium]|nr:hypothetical protein [Akkermansiaceae bacterium]
MSAPVVGERDGILFGAAIAGTVDAVVQWIELGFLPGLTYENAPGSGRGHHWLNPLTPIRLRTSATGESVSIRSWYCDEHLTHRET